MPEPEPDEEMVAFHREMERIVSDAQARHRCVEIAAQPDGSVIVPAEFVAALKIAPGQKCEVTTDGYGVSLRRAWVKPEPGAGERAVNAFRGTMKGLPGMTTDEIMIFLRGDHSGD
jgi:bifunctional DNA-binding transcriptional regulator/antitoxin component of YhaV-PrlF toxin-antitoxin module